MKERELHGARDARDQSPAPLREFLGTNRPLVVFAPSDRDGRYVEQMRRLDEAEEGLADRDMVVIRALAGDGTNARASGPTGLSDSLRDYYGVDGSQFVVLLVGKDGGVKRRSEEPVTTSELFSLIDSMPMRRREMRESDNA